MYRGTTPSLKIRLRTSLDLNDVKQCWVTLESATSSKEVTFDKSHVVLNPDDSTMELRLSQEETLRFGSGEINVQVRLLMTDDLAYASNIKNVRMNQILKDGVINE